MTNNTITIEAFEQALLSKLAYETLNGNYNPKEGMIFQVNMASFSSFLLTA